MANSRIGRVTGTGLTAWARSAWQSLRKLPLKEGIDTAAKLAAPAAVIVGALLAQSFQSSLTVTQLLSAREESDTKIRAEMFKAITDRLVGGGDKLTPERQAVFAELLALNFHEHIELKPLMSEVDDSLLKTSARASSDSARDSIEAKREELRSVARRVRARQTAMLYRPSRPEASDATRWGSWLSSAHAAEQKRNLDGQLRMIGVRFHGYRPGHKLAENSPCDVNEDPKLGEVEGQNVCVREPVFENAPDQSGALAVTITNGDKDKQSFTLEVKPLNSPVQDDPAQNGPQGKSTGSVAQCDAKAPDTKNAGPEAAQGVPSVQFETTWFDFPLTDNSLLSSGSRYAIFIDQVCYDKKKRLDGVKLGLLWFPRDYFPARERPMNHRQLREKLNLPVRE